MYKISWIYSREIMDKWLKWLNNLFCFEVVVCNESYSKVVEEFYIL